MNRLNSSIRKAGGLWPFVVENYRGRRWYALRIWGLVAGAVVRVYRPLLRRVEFIAITGSCGKTTTKELIGGALASKFRGTRSPDNDNQPWHIASALLRVRPRDDFSVQEVGIYSRDAPVIDAALDLIRPTIGVVTNIGSDHISSYGSLEAIAAEKGKLVERLPSTGTAILNADDPHVLAMRARCTARVITYGLAPGATVRAANVSSVWPSRLSFDAVYENQIEPVCTDLCGDHWVSAALATIAVSIAMGMSLREAADAMRSAPPFERRMEPIRRADGVWFVFDNAKSPLWTIPATFRFMRDARASRRFIVVGTVSDYKGDPGKVYGNVAREALQAAEHVVFVGSKASKSRAATHGVPDPRLRAFYSLKAACEHFCTVLQPGDLVLLKGTPNDHLERIYKAGILPQRPPATATTVESAQREGPARPAGQGWVQVVVGLGNPGEKYQDTPHNVGHAVVDILARFFGVPWIAEPEVLVATVPLSTGIIYLVKSRGNVNDTGSALQALSPRLGFAALDCVLLQDDLNLPPGGVRSRHRGNDGGHNGVRSVLSALRSIEIRRVKIGIGRPDADLSATAYVLTPMDAQRREVMRKAYLDAACRALTLLGDSAPAHAELLDVRARFEASISAISPLPIGSNARADATPLAGPRPPAKPPASIPQDRQSID